VRSQCLVIPIVVLATVVAGDVCAQTSSLAVRKRQAEIGKVSAILPREATRMERNAVYDRHSWVTVKPAPPKTFQVGDLLTIVVRETRKFEADADLETKKEFDIKSELEAFFKLTTRLG